METACELGHLMSKLSGWLAGTDEPTNGVGNLDGFNASIGGKSESTVQIVVWVDSHRHTRSDVLDEDLVRRVLVNPHATIFEENREVLAPELVSHFCCSLCHCDISF